MVIEGILGALLFLACVFIIDGRTRKLDRKITALQADIDRLNHLLLSLRRD